VSRSGAISRRGSSLASLLLLAAAAAHAEPDPGGTPTCPAARHPDAETLMASLEADFRRDARIVRMDIGTRYGLRAEHPTPESGLGQKTLWGVLDGDLEETWLLYVFSDPGRLAGTTLLLQDFADPASPDVMWLYLRSLDIFKVLEPESQRAMVPGTGLTYADSRGFIPRDRFSFSFPTSRGDTPVRDERLVLACPKTPSIREQFGYDSVLLRINPQKRLVIHAIYTDTDARLLKSYALRKAIQLGDRWLPGEVELEHQVGDFVTSIHYEYWLPEARPPTWLFEPASTAESFLERLHVYLKRVGLGSRLGQEIEESDREVREFEEKLQRLQQRATSP
jgi:hypothetical protein